MREEHHETQAQKAPFSERLRVAVPKLVVLAGLVLLGLVVAGVLLAPPQRAVDAVNRVRAQASELEQSLDERAFDVPAYGHRLEEASRKVRQGFEAVPGDPIQAPSVSPWSPELLTAWGTGESNVIGFYPPTDVTAVGDRGRIEVYWTQDERNNVALSRVTVERSTSGGPFLSVAELEGDAVGYMDRDVKAGVTYGYRILASTEEPLVPAPSRTTAPSSVVSCEGVADFKIRLLSANRETQEARLEVQKWHEDRWWTREFTVTEGAAVGEVDPGLGVDYGTGRKLKSLGFIEEDKTEQRLLVVFDANGSVLLEGGSPVTEAKDVEVHLLRVVGTLSGGGLPEQTLELVEKR